MRKLKKKHFVLIIAFTCLLRTLKWTYSSSTRRSLSDVTTRDINYNNILNTYIPPTSVYDNASHHEDVQVKQRSADTTYSGFDVTMRNDQFCPWDGISPQLDEKTKKKYEVHDLLRATKPTFLSNYKNPCWFKEDTRTLLCLPYFHLAGFHKCGTTGTFNTIVGHPDVAAPNTKETHWFAFARFKENSDIRNFTKRFSTSAREIERRVLKSQSGETFHPMITGDGSPSTVCDNAWWRYFMGNYNCTEPRVLTPHYVYHHTPSAKVIIMIRNPTERMISAYNYMTTEYPVVTAESFHQEVVNEIRTLEECFSVSSVRTCIYDTDIIMPLRTGLYHVFISDWMKVFPREQLLIARLEDVRGDPYTSFSEIFDFLDLSDGSPSTVCDNAWWRYFMGNYNCTEPRVLTPHYVYHHTPSAKVIIMIRNPTESDWMKVFPREQLLIARLEDVRGDPYTSFSEIFDFLDLSPVSSSQLKKMQNVNNNRGKTRFTARDETRRLLDNFYRPYNILLAKLLHNRFPVYM